jgi:hypothetical protein
VNLCCLLVSLGRLLGEFVLFTREFGAFTREFVLFTREFALFTREFVLFPYKCDEFTLRRCVNSSFGGFLRSLGQLLTKLCDIPEVLCVYS